MNLLENDITEVLLQNYDVSVGYIDSSKEITVDGLNNGIVSTKELSHNSIIRCSEISPWTSEVLLKNKFYHNENKIYICLYTPGTQSIIAPTGNLQSNIILDDNYVWRYITDIQVVVDDKHVIPDFSLFEEKVRKGTVSSINIIQNSGHQITNYAGFYTDNSFTNGVGLNYVVENNQSTFVISDILVQDGGVGYSHGDIITITDTPHSDIDRATVDVYVENGQVKLSSFTNGNNYDYMDIIIIGDGVGASVTFSIIAGVLTNVNVIGGSGYTWAKAIVLNSEVYVIGELEIEPLNGYNADLVRHIGPNKYIIENTFNDISSEINFYGIHRKNNNQEKYVFFDNMYFIDTFVPLEGETVKLKLILG